MPRVFLPAILSGFLLWASFYPLNQGWIAWFALVPWLTLVRAEGVSNRRRYLAAYCGGLIFFGLAVNWLRHAHPMMFLAWLALAAFCAGYFPLALWLVRRLDRLGRPPLALSFALVWVSLEYLRAHFPTGFEFLRVIRSHQYSGFAWYFLGHTQHEFTRLIQVVDVGGVYAVSFLVAFVNGLLTEWLVRVGAFRRLIGWPAVRKIGFVREMWTSSLAVLLVMAFVGYGSSRLVHPDFAIGPRVSALQGNIPQDVKSENADATLKEYLELTEIAKIRQPDLIVWPETCYPAGWAAVADGVPDRPEHLRKALADNQVLSEYAFKNWRRNVLIGTGVDEWDGERYWRFNSAILLNADGTYGGRYDKMHLVPFGEYVPFRETFPWLRNFTPHRSDYSCRPGDTPTRFALQVGDVQYTFAVLICYEDTDPSLARQYNQPTADGERPVDFLVNISNDGWFQGSEEHEQHLAICKFRAIEARRPIVRAVNVGISAIIDSDGRIQALPNDSLRTSKKFRGLVTDKLRLDPRPSLYAQYGDWLPRLTALFVVVGLILGAVSINRS